jgi:hypothetical protein
MYKEDEYLAHYGVLGMRWGVRRKTANIERRIGDAKRGAATIRKVGGKYADSIVTKQKRIQQKADVRIAKAKGDESLVRKATEGYAKAMDAKAKRIEAKLAKINAKSKNDPSWLKKQADEWKKAFKEAAQEFEREEANKDWADRLVDDVRIHRRRKRTRETLKKHFG